MSTSPATAPVRNARDLDDEGAPIVLDSAAVSLITKGEIDAQIATARAYPRDIRKFLNELETMACSSQDVAASCFYKLKRKEKDGGTKFIEGPSVRFAELAVMAYGNARVQGRTTHDDGQYVYCLGTAMDLEKNVGIQVEVRRRITDRNGRRFSDDMVGVTANAAISIGVRNAIFRVVPRALWETIFERAKATAVGTQKSFLERRQGMVEYFTQKIGVTVEQMCEYMEIANLEAMTLDDLENMVGLATALKENTTTVDEAFPKKAAPEAAGATTGEPGSSPLSQMAKSLARENAAATGQPQPPATDAPPATEPPPADITPAESQAMDLELAAQDGDGATAEPKKVAKKRE